MGFTDHFDKWAKDSMIMEQALQNVPEDLAVWLRERKPDSLEGLAK